MTSYLQHRFRTTPFFQLNTLWLEQEKLCWHKGKKVRRIALANIRSLRLQTRLHKGKALQLCTLTTDTGSYTLSNVESKPFLSQPLTSLKNDSDASFGHLVSALAEKVQHTNPAVQLLDGTPPSIMLLNYFMLAVAFLIITIGLVMMWESQALALTPMLMIALVGFSLPALYGEIRQGKAVALSLKEFISVVRQAAEKT